VKCFYSENSLFIGARGAVSRTRLDSTVARYLEDACPLRRSEGDVFFTEIQRFSWNRIVGVNPLPRWARVGERRKTCHLETLSSTKFMKWVFREVEYMKIWNLAPAKPWSREHVKICNLKSAKLWSREPVKIWNHELAKPWSRESMKIRSHEPAKLWSHEPAKLWNRESVKFGNLLKSKFWSYGAWRFP
jgi:hypothetical protein